MYSMPELSCTVCPDHHVQYALIIMYSSMPQSSCIVYPNHHVQYTPIIMCSMPQSSCTVCPNHHVQYAPIFMYDTPQSSCTVCSNHHITQLTPSTVDKLVLSKVAPHFATFVTFVEKSDTISGCSRLNPSSEIGVDGPILSLWPKQSSRKCAVEMGWKGFLVSTISGLGKKKQVCSDVESTNRCFIEIHRTTKGILVLYLYFRVSGTLGPGFSGAARFSHSRRAHVKAKGTLDSVEHKNCAVGEQKVGQPRRPTSCVFFSWRPRTELEWSNELDSFCGGQQVAFVLRGDRLE